MHKAVLKLDGDGISSATLTKMKSDVRFEPLTPSKKRLSHWNYQKNGDNMPLF